MNQNIPAGTPDTPFMGAHEIEAIRATLEGFRRPVRVLEWGSGRSTIYFSRLLPTGSSWHSIEHQPHWHELVADMLRPEDDAVISRTLIEPDRPYHEGTDDGDFGSFRSYILFPSRLGKRFDFILVDGRARVECMAVGWDLLAEDGIMALHDAQRSEYVPGIPSGCSYLKLVNTSEWMEGHPAILFMARTPERLLHVREAISRNLPAGISLESNCSPPPESGHHSALFINTYYGGFLQTHYTRHSELSSQPYLTQKESLQRHCFGDSDFYSCGLKTAGWNADDLIANCAPLQLAWARENGFEGLNLQEILLEQIRSASPDVVYLQDLNMATTEFIRSIRPYTSLIVGQIASPLPPQADLKALDIVFSSFPHFVERFRQMGIAAYYQPLAFEPRVLQLLPESHREWPVTFVGGISSHHGKGLETLRKIAELVPLDCWGYGADSLPPDSPLRSRHHGEVWGLDMFTVLRRSCITVNRHIDVAENAANNMRLFEATGCGALLITDYKDNLNELFEIGKEVVAYRSPEECAALIRYYRANPGEAEAIARAGQLRTLREHTYSLRMEQTAEIFERHLRYRRQSNRYQQPEHVSSGYRPLSSEEITESLCAGWQDTSIPDKQRWLVQQELAAMYAGQIPAHFVALAELVKPCLGPATNILEIGCSSGYYYEILEYLLNRRIDYTGADYSPAMIDMARQYYSRPEFVVADGSDLPFSDRQFDIAISSCVLLHVANYPEHIAETARVAKQYVVAHRTPISRTHPTSCYGKTAYGVETVEFCFNEKEFLSLFRQEGFVLESYREIAMSSDGETACISYLFERQSGRRDATIP